MRNRGAALPTVLALITVILVAGLAMGSLSTLSLQFNKKQLDTARSELAARSGLALFLAKLQENNATTTMNPLVPEPVDLAGLFPGGLTHEENGYTVNFHFDPNTAGYSTNNLSGDVPKLGWPDSDDVPRVPPFALDLILNVETPRGDTIRYRSALGRVWPFAVFGARGPVVLMGQPDHVAGTFPMPTKVTGDIYTSWRGNEAGGGTVLQGYGFGELTDPSDLLANLEAREGYHPQDRPDWPLIIGMPVGYNPPQNPDILERVDDDGDEEEEVFYSYSLGQVAHDLGDTETDSTFNPGSPEFNDIENELDGDFYYDHDLDFHVEPVLVGNDGDNEMTGDIHLRRSLSLDPLHYIASDTIAPTAGVGSDYTELIFGPPSDEAITKFNLDPTLISLDDDDDGAEPFLLTETLRLTETENSTGGPLSSHYLIEGSISNRQVIHSNDDSGGHPTGLFVREVLAGLDLQGTVLYVKGDLDLGATKLNQPIPISGSGATLIVDGKLVLGNAQIDAQDQGFVIYARDIVLKGGGTFNGLMIAGNSITVLSQNDEPLEVRGAILCGGVGGVTLRGADVTHDPTYLKSINGGGDFYLASWRKI